MALRTVLLIVVKAVHSAIFFALQTMICYLLYKGVRGESDRRSGIVAAIIGAECAIYAGNGFRCPLTGIAEDLGAESGSVTDIFLPKWLAANVANIYAPMFGVALLLHGRNLLRRREATRGQPGSGRRQHRDLALNLAREAFE
jgi:hypothetical protein